MYMADAVRIRPVCNSNQRGAEGRGRGVEGGVNMEEKDSYETSSPVISRAGQEGRDTTVKPYSQIPWGLCS